MISVNNHIDLFELYITVFYNKTHTTHIQCTKIKNNFFFVFSLKKNYKIFLYIRLTANLVIRQGFSPVPDG